MPFSFSQSIAYAKESISIKWSRIINFQPANQSKVRNGKSEKTLLGGGAYKFAIPESGLDGSEEGRKCGSLYR